jgi:hypothetical protein
MNTKECPLCGKPSPDGLHYECEVIEKALGDRRPPPEIDYSGIIAPCEHSRGGILMTKERTNCYISVSWLSKLMAGDTQCQWGAWFKAHYRDYPKAPSDFQRAKWLIEHNKQLNELRAELEPQATAMYREGQNKFTLPRKTAVIGGVPDLVALGKDGNYTVYDVKTGQVRPSDVVQVMLYMACLPYSTKMYRGKKLAGCVVYTTERTPIPPEAIDETFKKQVAHFLNILDNDSPPAKTPSYTECRFCEITNENCPERIDTEDTSDESVDLPI